MKNEKKIDMTLSFEDFFELSTVDCEEIPSAEQLSSSTTDCSSTVESAVIKTPSPAYDVTIDSTVLELEDDTDPWSEPYMEEDEEAFPDDSSEEEARIVYDDPVVDLPIDQVHENDDNPRDVDPSSPSYLALKDSIEKNGMNEPIIVVFYDGRFIVVSGSRRLSICKALGHKSIKARIHADSSIVAVLRTTLDGNLHRSRISSHELIQIIQLELRLLKVDDKDAIKNLSIKYGLCERHIRRYISIIRGLPAHYWKLIDDKLEFTAAVDINRANLDTNDLDLLYDLILASPKKLNTYDLKQACIKEHGRDLLEKIDIVERNIKFNRNDILDICGDLNVSAKDLKQVILDIVAKYKHNADSV